MPEKSSNGSLNPRDAHNANDTSELDRARLLHRSPHPYHHLSNDLCHASDRFPPPKDAKLPWPKPEQDGNGPLTSAEVVPYRKDSSSPPSDSGTEADDEHFLKGLPAPRGISHKGVRGQNEILSGTSTPVASPAIPQEGFANVDQQKLETIRKDAEKKRMQARSRMKKNLGQRATELFIIATLNHLVRTNPQVRPLLHAYSKDFALFALLYSVLLVLYPLRVILSEYRRGRPSTTIPLKIPTTFDPAPLLWPPALTIWASLLIARDNPAVILPNMVLAISSLPQQLVPKIDHIGPYDPLHWALSCLPTIWNVGRQDFLGSGHSAIQVPLQDMIYLYPLHRILCAVLHELTTTSLLTAELQLFSIALVNLLLLTSSPQMQILKTLLLGGGLSMLVACSSVIQSSIILAKVPRWRFHHDSVHRPSSLWSDLLRALSWKKIRADIMGSGFDDMSTPSSSSEDEARGLKPTRRAKGLQRVQTLGPGSIHAAHVDKPEPQQSMRARSFEPNGIVRRHTLGPADNKSRSKSNYTPSGRRKRATSTSVRPFLRLTYFQATLKKWMYAIYVYIIMLAVIVLGLRTHIEKTALRGSEPFGWALAYFFADLPGFRLQVVKANLERWICLPPRPGDLTAAECLDGWVQRVRHFDLGEANVRLLLSAYWVVVVLMGLITVLQLQEVYEVDTRRKVFHFTMVGMLLPTIFIDPNFVSLALIIVLIGFLILDLLRASQLPPLSKPIASFLAPYVDGRDFRGPVVISHIFLLIGCAIPLWLALASLPRTGTDHMTGWEVPTREVSLVSGVICVGLGDAAASLIGRRIGRRKWFWGGGKSIEGSVAFAAAVFVGLAMASAWLHVGGWPVADEQPGWGRKTVSAGVCASIASITEAVLTGGNDNVIVPVVLWTCVKSLGV